MARSLLIVAAVVSLLWCDAHSSNHSRRSESEESVQQVVSIHHTHVLYPKKQLVKLLQSSILRQLNRTEAPNVTQTPPLSSYLMRLMDSKDENEFNKFILPHNRLFACFESNRWDCSRFEFEVTPDNNTIKSVLMWIRKTVLTTRLTLSVYFNRTSDTQQYDEFTSDIRIEHGWIGFTLQTSALEDVGGILSCIVEVTGGNIYERGEETPFLQVTKSSTPGRQRRGANDSSSANCDCCVVDRFVSTTDLQWENWVLAPQVLNIRACQGTCRYSQSSFNLSYASTMYNLLKNNLSHANAVDAFWVPHCFPKKMSPLKIIYITNKTREIVETDLKDFVIDTCACEAMNCHKS